MHSNVGGEAGNCTKMLHKINVHLHVHVAIAYPDPPVFLHSWVHHQCCGNKRALIQDYTIVAA